MQETLTTLVTDLERLLIRLKRFTGGERRPLDELILDALRETEGATTHALRCFIHRDRKMVLTTLRLLQEAGRVVREPNEPGGIWRIRE